jgi:hypothetical protein
MKIIVEVKIMKCEKEDESDEIIKKWIEVEIEKKNDIGNIYGLCGVMMGI